MVSSPIDSRIRPSFTPRSSLFSLGIEACVIVAGWLTKLSTPPKLSARVKTSNLLRQQCPLMIQLELLHYNQEHAQS